MRGRFTAAALIAAVGLSAAAPALQAASLTVFAAASLRDALEALATRFQSDTGDKVIFSFGGSNALARQIEAGAPADIFLSADTDWMDYLDARHLLAPGTRANLLRNALVLVAPASSTSTLKIGPGFGLGSALGSGKLAMANPDSVPAGKYGKSALQALGVWEHVEKQVARTENVRAALTLVSRGEAAYGIVYETDALAEHAVRILDRFPPSTHPAIVYPIAILERSNSSSARAFVAYLESPEARTTWEKFGFSAAPRPGSEERKPS